MKGIQLQAKHVSLVAAAVASLCAILVAVQTAQQPRTIEIRHETAILVPSETPDDALDGDGAGTKDMCEWTDGRPECAADEDGPI